MNQDMNVMVNHPSHYTDGKIEVIDYIEDKKFNHHLGNAIKYISRAGKKDDYVTDLQKAVWYINREIERYQRKNKTENKVVYVSHPYGGKEINRLKVESIIHELIKKYPDHTFISPIHAFLFAYDFYPYEQGLEMCFRLLDKCDEMMVCGDWSSSRGCKAEVDYAKESGIPYRFLDGRDE